LERKPKALARLSIPRAARIWIPKILSLNPSKSERRRDLAQNSRKSRRQRKVEGNKRFRPKKQNSLGILDKRSEERISSHDGPRS
jgi:hypothetical protein